MIDEIAINPMAGYHRNTKQVHGFCFDHSSGVSFSATSNGNIQRLRDRENECLLGLPLAIAAAADHTAVHKLAEPLDVAV